MAFDEPFYTLLPAPPLGPLDRCYPSWQKTNRMALERARVAAVYGDKSKEYQAARDRYYEAARQYAFCMDDTWGKDEF